MNIEQLQAYEIPKGSQDYGWRDALLYALSLGYGEDPTDLAQLRYVYEQDQRVVPSMCLMLAYPGLWLQAPALEINWSRIFNGEVSFEVHASLPVQGTVHTESRVVAVNDKGPGKGATLHTERILSDARGGRLATIAQTVVLRADGGGGGFGVPPQAQPVVPDGPPDATIELATARNAALLYRLNGDYHPLHADPAVAEAMGLKAPIVHGFCTFGMACRAAIAAVCGGDAQRIRRMAGRFVSPVYPGDTIQFQFFVSGARVQWRARVDARQIVVIDRGLLELK